jgi:hypothetical protein
MAVGCKLDPNKDCRVVMNYIRKEELFLTDMPSFCRIFNIKLIKNFKCLFSFSEFWPRF